MPGPLRRAHEQVAAQSDLGEAVVRIPRVDRALSYDPIIARTYQCTLSMTQIVRKGTMPYA